jgi:uncharacterized protein with beta-barrel porin domain
VLVGFMKDIKDMKTAVAGLPTVIHQADAVAAQGQQMMVAEMQAQREMAATATQQLEAKIAAAARTADLSPIAGVSLEIYAAIARGLVSAGYDPSKAEGVAASRGVAPDSWRQAMDGWNARIVANPAIAKQFNQFYAGA